MGDGGVACIPLQQHSNIMERFPIQDKPAPIATSLCTSAKTTGNNNNKDNSNSSITNSNSNVNGNNNTNGSNKNNNNSSSNNNGKIAGNGLNPKPKKIVKKIIKVKKIVPSKKTAAAGKSGLKWEKEAKSGKETGNVLSSVDKKIQHGKDDSKVSDSKDDNKVDQNSKEEVEEGELGTLKWPPKADVEKGEFVPAEKPRRSEIEKGEIVGEKWRKGDIEKGEIVTSKFRKGELSRDDIENGEFIPDRWHIKGDYSYSKSRARYETCRERTPPSGKYSTEEAYRRKEFNRSGSSQHSKIYSRWEIGQDRSIRISSKIVDEEGSFKSEYSNGKSHGRDYASVNRLKRHGTDSDSSEHKYYGDYAGSKSRRLSEDNTRSSHSEHYSRHSMERFHRNSSSSRIFSLDKYSSRHHESILSSKVVYERHARSPGHSEQSPHDKVRYQDHRDRSPVYRERSPYGREKSPYVRERSPYVRERSPYVRERSPYDRSRHYDHRNRSPTYSERSPHDRARYHDRRDRTPNYREKPPLDRAKPNTHEEGSRKGGANKKRNSQHGSKGQEDKLGHKESNGRDLQNPDRESQDRSNMHNVPVPDEKTASCESHKEEQSLSPGLNAKESPHANGAPEELLSMEEDMDICDTPPHVPMMSDSMTGKWFYLDYFGLECGPSKLCDLRALVNEGLLVSDHFIKHLDSDRWVTIENAVSPLVTANFQSIVSDSITQLVSPPEAPGNLLKDTRDTGQSSALLGEEMPGMLLASVVCSDDNATMSGSFEDLHIDERVGALLDGYTVIPGRELETIGEVLQVKLENVQWEGWGKSEVFTWHKAGNCEEYGQNVNELSRYSDMKTTEDEVQLTVDLADKDLGFASFADSDDWYSGGWSCKGGDWKRNDDTALDRFSRRKLVLNDGFPLCQMPKSGSEDPRWHRKDDLYYPSQSRRLDLPPWAFSCSDERNECGGVSRSMLSKPPTTRGMKGSMLPVVRINACVVKDHGSFVSESRSKVRGKDRYSSRSSRTYSGTNDMKRLTAEGDSQSKAVIDQESHDSWKSITSMNTLKDRLCTVDDMQLQLGEWYYLDGSGHEQGPLSFSDLQVLADQGTIPKYSSVFRKFDRLWVPIISAVETSKAVIKIDMENAVTSSDFSRTLSNAQSGNNNESNSNYSSFHSLHPQFIGYTSGKLHELVMKSYKSREFAAAINEVLDPWIVTKQPKKESDKHIYRRSDIDARGKRARMQVNESDDDYEIEEDMQMLKKDDITFEELCGDAAFQGEESISSEAEMGSWGLLDGCVLARIFYMLRFDMKSLAVASLTCKRWRAAVSFFKNISRGIDLSSVGPNCTDSIIWNVMNGYNKDKITSVVLAGCTNITPGMLEEIIRSFPRLSSIDIRGCSQLTDFVLQFPNISWVKSRGLHGTRASDEFHFKTKSLKQIGEKTTMFYKTKALSSGMDDFGELKEYFDSVNKRDSANQLFRRSLYRRSKLFDARKSSSILSRDARMRRWALKKSENRYKRMEGFLASGLKDIMKENTFELFVPKVAEIEDRMKSGYYIGHGLRSVKEDISRMCRDAIKAKSRGAGDMNRIITLFLRLASRLEESSKFSYERDELMKSWKDDLSGSVSIKYKKKLVGEKKYLNRSNGSTFVNGSFDHGEYASDREIRKRLSKLNRKSMDSGSETSDDFDRSSDYGRSDDGESTASSDTESDLDFQSDVRTQESRGDGYFTADESFDSMTDEREWGARMTKASLVPPVTRKYEVIDQYVIVEDEEDVKRKMCVALPDDYAEKLEAQKNGTEELDMELPEVKDYKPRKQLGDEVVEQEVYGIDPYTHNLLLDSMPEEVDWSLSEKHLFIEDMLLRTLNKQVRCFTGFGNTPMTYPLQPVIEEIERFAEEDCDIRMMKLCRGILKAIDNRPDDNYVAYRKGLGVVCNKEGGFGEEDFVVEFLGEVYPAWKWFEKQDGIRSLQKDSKDPAPEFYNIYLERPKGDAEGYDLVVVDAMHKANYASRICHSCKPNCEAKVTAVDGRYQIGIYTVREIRYGEEVTFDYNSVTECKEEYEASVCLCGSQVCRGSYLNLTGEGAFQKVLKELHGMLDRHLLMLEACDLNAVSEEDYLDLGRAGLGSCLLGGLPDWVVAYSARLVRFINLERTKLPEEILKHNVEEKRKYFSHICLEDERNDAEVQAEGVYNQRLQNLAVTLDKVRYVMRCVFGDAKRAPPPLEKLSPEEAVSFLWKGEGSLVGELLQCMAPHLEANMLNDLKSKICVHDPLNSDDIQKELQKSLLWLRDEIRSLPCTYKCRHDAAADLIHVYAYTKCFFRIREYNTFTSPPVYISPLDLGPKYTDKLGAGVHEYQKTYGENYCLGQLIFWHIQTNAKPDFNLSKAIRGCLSLPDVGSFYAKVQKPSQQRIYGPKTLKMMLEKIEKYPQRPWPKDQIWSFKSSPKVIGSPMLDAVLSNSPVDKEMLYWLKHRPSVYTAMWDR